MEPRRVLVVEDNAVNQKVAVAMLRSIGYEADVVPDGLRALDAISRNTYEAVLMDCHMHGLDGYRATEVIRRREGDGRHTPIIAMTAAVTNEDRERALAAGMDDFIEKPVEMERLISVLARWARGEKDRIPAQPPASDPDPTEPAVVDLLRLAELRGLNQGSEEDVLGELVELFVRSSLERLPQLQRAAARGDAETLREDAHRLRGAAVNIGATQMASLCGQLEQMASAGEVSVGAAAQLVRRIEEAFQRAREALGSTS